MKVLMAFVFVAVILSVPLVAQMTPQYTLYQSFVFDSQTNTLTSTVTIQGTTVGSCTMTVTCCQSLPGWPYYTCGTCQEPIPGCTNATHTPKITNRIGAVGGDTTGSPVPAFGYINYSVSVAASVTPGTVVQGDVGACVSCSVIGSFWCNGWQFGLAFTKSKWNGVSSSFPDGSKECQVTDWCTPETSPPKCSPSTVIQIPIVPGAQATCRAYYDTDWFWETPPGGLTLCFPLFPGDNGTGTDDPSLKSCTK